MGFYLYIIIIFVGVKKRRKFDDNLCLIVSLKDRHKISLALPYCYNFELYKVVSLRESLLDINKNWQVKVVKVDRENLGW